MNGDQLVAKILKKEGVEWLSCFPAQSLIDACAREGIRPILCRQERAGVNLDPFGRCLSLNRIDCQWPPRRTFAEIAQRVDGARDYR